MRAPHQIDGSFRWTRPFVLALIPCPSPPSPCSAHAHFKSANLIICPTLICLLIIFPLPENDRWGPGPPVIETTRGESSNDKVRLGTLSNPPDMANWIICPTLLCLLIICP